MYIRGLFILKKEELNKKVYLWPPYILSYKWKDFLALKKPIILFIALLNLLIVMGLLVLVVMVVSGFINSPGDSVKATYTTLSPYGIFAGFFYLFLVHKLFRDVLKTFRYLLVKKIY